MTTDQKQQASEEKVIDRNGTMKMHKDWSVSEDDKSFVPFCRRNKSWPIKYKGVDRNINCKSCLKFMADVRRINHNGYVLVKSHGHPRANPNGYVFEHILVAEKALGKFLPEGAVIHHVNEDKQDNSPSNLVICPDNKYHQLIHRRLNAKKACGSPNWLRCYLCQQYDDPKNLSINGINNCNQYHKKCATKRWRDKKPAVQAATRYLKSKES